MVEETQTRVARDLGLSKDKPYVRPDQPYASTAVAMPQPQNADSSALKRCHVLSHSEQLSRDSDIEDQAWTLVRKRKQKHKGGQRSAPTSQSKFEHKAITLSLLDSANQPHPTHCPRPLPPPVNGSEDVLPTSPSSVVPTSLPNHVSQTETFKAISTFKALPPSSILRRTRDLNNANTKISASTSKQPAGLFSYQPHRPRSASRRLPSAPVFLPPHLYRLPIRDVHHPPLV